MGLVSYSRAMTPSEHDVLSVAAEIVRAQLDDRLPDDVSAQMRAWSARLKASHDELCDSLRITSAEV